MVQTGGRRNLCLNMLFRAPYISLEASRAALHLISLQERSHLLADHFASAWSNVCPFSTLAAQDDDKDRTNTKYVGIWPNFSRVFLRNKASRVPEVVDVYRYMQMDRICPRSKDNYSKITAKKHYDFLVSLNLSSQKQ